MERLVAEYVAGSTSAELGRRYGIAKSSVLWLVREAGKSVRHPRLEPRARSLNSVSCTTPDCRRRTSRTTSAEAQVPCGVSCSTGAGSAEGPPGLIERSRRPAHSPNRIGVAMVDWWWRSGPSWNGRGCDRRHLDLLSAAARWPSAARATVGPSAAGARRVDCAAAEEAAPLLLSPVRVSRHR